MTSPPGKGSQTDTHNNNPFSVIFVPVELRQHSPKQLLSPSNWRFRLQDVSAFTMIGCTAAGAGNAPGSVVLQNSRH
jgi:hypothetical protein